MKTVFITILFMSVTANADFSLANNGKPVNCGADDNQSWILNKARTTVKFIVEGESLGAKKITATRTDNASFISYVTEEGILTLGPKDTYQLSDEKEALGIECD